MSVISAGVMAIMSVVNSFGTSVVAGYGAAKRLDSIIMLPPQALATSVNSMAGQNIGANNWKRVHKITLYGFLYSSAIMLLLDRKSTRLNSSHVAISYAAFCFI